LDGGVEELGALMLWGADDAATLAEEAFSLPSCAVRGTERLVVWHPTKEQTTTPNIHLVFLFRTIIIGLFDDRVVTIASERDYLWSLIEPRRASSGIFPWSISNCLVAIGLMVDHAGQP
jgi:hypothetical protein